MESLPCRKCGREVSERPPRCPYCGTENPIITYNSPGQEAKAQAIVALFALAVMAGTALLIFLLWS